MQISLETPGGLSRHLHVQIPAERLERAVAERLKRIAGRAKLPGFRPGKAPMKVIEAQYKDAARYEVINDLLRETYPEALNEAKVQPAGAPEFEVISEAGNDGLKYVAKFDVYPDVSLDKLDTLAVTRPVVTISEGDVDKLIDNLRRARRSFEVVSRPAAVGDTVKLDFVGTLDGVEFPGGKGENIEFEIGSSQFLPDLENGMVGRSAGEQFIVDVSFPADYRAENLKGKTAQFAATLKEVREAKLPALDDADFLNAHGVGGDNGGVAALREKSRQALENERNKAIKARLKTQVLDQLLAAHPIEVPASLIAQELPRLRDEAASRMNMGKLSAEKKAELLPDALFEATAKRRVALGLLISEVIKSKNIELDAARVEASLDEMANDYEQPEQVKQFYRGRPDLMQGLRAVVIEEQVVDALLAHAKVSEEVQSLEQLLNPPQTAPASV